jgi:hypothetical protein
VHAQALRIVALHNVFNRVFGISPIGVEDNVLIKLLGEIDEDGDEYEGGDGDDGNENTNPIPLSKKPSDWFGKPFLQQDSQRQIDKITDRANKIQIFANEHNPMGQEQLGVSSTYQVEVSQDKLNPLLQNTVSRYIIIDSQYRQATSKDTDLTTDFTLDLSEHLINVLSIRLSSIQIPFSWFNINSQRNFFYIYNRYNSNETYHLIEIERGNYKTIDDIFIAINKSFLEAGFKKTNGRENFIYIKNGMVFIDLIDTTINGNMLNLYDEESRDDNNVSGIFFYPLHDSEVIHFCDKDNKILRGRYDYENTLGWMLGYRQLATYIYPSGNPAEALYKLEAFNYLIVIINDFNQNHINNGIVTISEMSNKIPRNRYNTANNPYYCIRYDKTDGEFNPIKALDDFLLNNPISMFFEKIIPPYNDIVQLLPSAPRTIPQSAIYAANEMAKANAQTTRYNRPPPNNSDTFAIFPLSIKVDFGNNIIDTGSTLQLNKRVYFGPVNLDRLRVKILDDKGNLMDFNGCDWSITIIADCLYQY